MSEQDEIFAVTSTRLADAFRRIETTAMADVPILNRKLSVQCVGMSAFGQECVCVLITPWFINLVLIPMALSVPMRTGAKTRIALPGGIFEFIQSHHDELGAYRMCSLLSPVFEFDTQEDAVTVAQAILTEVLAPQVEAKAEDAEMLAIWEGRLPEPEAVEPEDTTVEKLDDEPKVLTRRAMFGIRSTEEAVS
ncbi:[NiFe]-hydrogenase assembly chaperone HybE (plasmid) [Rhizobium sp. T1470]|uniref:[NiFe]-hydrogenase assembly chaperone HybE n=1 Tax=unclassified Rhizobium TaxID=2613769 RepID=UPI001AAEBA32|nr:[NiFe]-hydrogenase assembly chaperone HybE [Rhizobium sp. T1473]MCA0806441.1 [NiFe]-hydrogenase assembly chaperone HybE [Rhizobium sp. T1473]